MTSDAEALARIRRGLGLIIFLAGVIHAFEMVLASLYSQGRLPVVIGAGLWSQMYFAQFLFLVMGSGLYLFLSFRARRTFYFEALVDFLVGLPPFTVLMQAIAQLLVRHAISQWWSLVPSAFLMAYGLFVRSGRSAVPKDWYASAKP